MYLLPELCFLTGNGSGRRGRARAWLGSTCSGASLGQSSSPLFCHCCGVVRKDGRLGDAHPFFLRRGLRRPGRGCLPEFVAVEWLWWRRHRVCTRAGLLCTISEGDALAATLPCPLRERSSPSLAAMEPRVLFGAKLLCHIRKVVWEQECARSLSAGAGKPELHAPQRHPPRGPHATDHPARPEATCWSFPGDSETLVPTTLSLHSPALFPRAEQPGQLRLRPDEGCDGGDAPGPPGEAAAPGPALRRHPEVAPGSPRGIRECQLVLADVEWVLVYPAVQQMEEAPRCPLAVRVHLSV